MSEPKYTLRFIAGYLGNSQRVIEIEMADALRIHAAEMTRMKRMLDEIVADAREDELRRDPARGVAQ